MKAIVATTPGDADVLEMIELPVPDPGAGEVRIRVRASAVNRADVLQRQGRYPVPPGAGPVLGMEAAGTIDAIGDGVTGWAIGDRAMALLAHGGYAEYVTA